MRFFSKKYLTNAGKYVIINNVYVNEVWRIEWKYKSGIFRGVSLHDCEISGWVIGEDTVVRFEDGFDVFAENPENSTGRHKRTGKAAVVLKKAAFISGKLSDDNGTAALTEDSITDLELDVLDFKRLPDSVLFACDAFRNGRDAGFCELEFSCADVIYCWNGYTGDAWFLRLNKRYV